jgi:hypothetical protein
VKWPARASRPVSAGRLNLMVMSAAFTVLGLSLLFQPRRWAATPAYHVLLQIFAAQVWGGLFLASGISLGLAAHLYGRSRPAVTAALMLALALTAGWMLAFIARYLTNGDTTPETWVSWAVFGFLLLRGAAGLDVPRRPRPHEVAEVGAYRRAVSAALAAAAADRKAAVAAALGDAADRQAPVAAALDAEAGRLSASVAAACDAYARALAAVVPAGAMPAGDPARTALDEARNALLRAEEAFTRATGRSASDQDAP